MHVLPTRVCRKSKGNLHADFAFCSFDCVWTDTQNSNLFEGQINALLSKHGDSRDLECQNYSTILDTLLVKFVYSVPNVNNICDFVKLPKRRLLLELNKSLIFRSNFFVDRS